MRTLKLTRMATMTLLAVLAAGCSGFDRYSMHQADESRTRYYRLDKLTGSVDLIEGRTMSRVLGPAKSDPNAGELRSWKADTIPEYGVVVKVWSKWRGGSLLYRLNFSPEARLAELTAQSAVTVYFCDEDGFVLCEVRAAVWELTPIVGRAGVTEYGQFEGSTPLTAGQYQAVAGVRLSWQMQRASSVSTP